MGKRHHLGRRNDILTVRLHETEMAILGQRAASAGLQKCDYVRKMMLSEPIKPLPLPTPPANEDTLRVLKMIHTRVVSMHKYCGREGLIDWSRQPEVDGTVLDNYFAVTVREISSLVTRCEEGIKRLKAQAS